MAAKLKKKPHTLHSDITGKEREFSRGAIDPKPKGSFGGRQGGSGSKDPFTPIPMVKAPRGKKISVPSGPTGSKTATVAGGSPAITKKSRKKT